MFKISKLTRHQPLVKTLYRFWKVKKSCFKYRESNYKNKTKSKANGTLFHKGKGNTCLANFTFSHCVKFSLFLLWKIQKKKNLRMQDVPMVGLGWRFQSQLHGLQANDRIAEQNFFNHLKPPTKRENIYLCSITSGQPEPNRCRQRVVKLCIINLLWGIVIWLLCLITNLSRYTKRK